MSVVDFPVSPAAGLSMVDWQAWAERVNRVYGERLAKCEAALDTADRWIALAARSRRQRRPASSVRVFQYCPDRCFVWFYRPPV